MHILCMRSTSIIRYCLPIYPIQLNVSEDTIRRDLQELDENGILTKVHGGALLNRFISP